MYEEMLLRHERKWGRGHLSRSRSLGRSRKLFSFLKCGPSREIYGQWGKLSSERKIRKWDRGDEELGILIQLILWTRVRPPNWKESGPAPGQSQQCHMPAGGWGKNGSRDPRTSTVTPRGSHHLEKKCLIGKESNMLGPGGRNSEQPNLEKTQRDLIWPYPRMPGQRDRVEGAGIPKIDLWWWEHHRHWWFPANCPSRSLQVFILSGYLEGKVMLSSSHAKPS